MGKFEHQLRTPTVRFFNRLYQGIILPCILYTALMTQSALVFAYDIHNSRHCLGGCPSNAPIYSELIIRDIYTLSLNNLTKLPDWAAYKVTKNTIGPSRKAAISVDPLLRDAEILEPQDYKGINGTLYMTKGQLVPLRSFTGTPYWKETLFTSNIIPQKIELNKGPWRDLETRVRKMALSPEIFAVYVMAGTIYESLQASLPNANEVHLIPSGYWKIISIKKTGKIKSAAFYFDQNISATEDYCVRMVNITSLENRTALHFFHELKDGDQQRLKRTQSQIKAELGC